MGRFEPLGASLVNLDRDDVIEVPVPNGSILKTATLAAIVSICVADGCGDGAATHEDLQAFCSSMCDWKIRCNKDDSTCQAKCESGEVNITYYKASFVHAMTDCFKTHPCDQSDDACFAAALQTVVPNYTSDEVFTKCNSVRQGCISAEKPAFSDDYCFTAMVLTEAAQETFTACYARPCEEMRGCMKAAMGEVDDG